MPIADVTVICCLILLIPKLVEKYLANLGFRRELRLIIVFGGMLWITFACTHGIFYPLLGIEDADATTFANFWYNDISNAAESHDYGLLIGKLTTPGRWFYVTYQCLFYYYTGGTVTSILAVNSFMAFWGGLVLTRTIYRLCPGSSSTKTVFPLVIVFVPSVVFWSSANLKEAIIYWAICQAFAFIVALKLVKWRVGSLIFFVFAASIGILIRPHIMAFWCAAIILIKMFEPGFWKYAVVLVLLSPLAVGLSNGRLDFRSIGPNLKTLELNKRAIITRGEFRSVANSTFDYGEVGPIPILSGIKNTLFRPILWQVRSLRSLLAALEIWTVSLGILFLWIRMTNTEWKRILRNPAIWVALLVCIPFFAFFVYFPNEGLIARQRVQLFPALLVLFVTPILMRQSAGSRAQSRKGMAQREGRE